MPALNFVALEDGFEDDPELAALARNLRVSKAVALWSVVKLRRFVLRRGNHVTGHLPRQISAEILAAALDFPGKPRVLVGALKANGYLGCRRGRGFYYPQWSNTTTGQYAARRESDRRWHERERAAKRRSDDVVRPSADASSDRLSTSSDKSTERKEERNPAGPPVRPPRGGQAEGATRWDWLMKNAPTPQNREVCTRHLDAMTAEDWSLVQWAYTARQRGGANISQKSLRTLAWPTDVFLRKTAYLRFARFKVAAESAANAPAKPGEKSPRGKGAQQTSNDMKAQKKAAATKFILELVADPDLAKAEKELRKAEHEKTWGERPWEKAK